jgi:hypothetical protein
MFQQPTLQGEALVNRGVIEYEQHRATGKMHQHIFQVADHLHSALATVAAIENLTRVDLDAAEDCLALVLQGGYQAHLLTDLHPHPSQHRE